MSETQKRWTLNCGGCLGLIGILILLAIVSVIIFYVEEDWRGASELTKAKQRWQDAGFSLTASDYYPPAVPDGRNLSALPIFQLEPDPTDSAVITSVKLRQATDTDKHGGPLQDTRNKTDLAVLVAKAYASVFPKKTPPTSPLAQLEELYPLIPELRDAAKTRTTFRLNQKYDYPNPLTRPLGPVVAQIAVAKLLSSDAKLALRENQPQVALDDIHLAYQLARGTATDPSLVGGLVSIGVAAITRATIDDELAKHTWNDEQLAAIQAELKRLDYLALFQFDMRCEVAVNWLPMCQFMKSRQDSMKPAWGMISDNPNSGPIETLRPVWADGWWGTNAALMANVMLDNAQTVNLITRIADPKRCQQISAQVDEDMKHPRPWNILAFIGMGRLSSSLEKFAQAQVQLDEDRIVCALERYRLAHNTYPPTLAALVPADIDDLPHDIMNGEPYHYRLNPDGTFLLYSVGWNQTDENGAIATQEDNPKSIDFNQGDWVWPMYLK